MITFLIVLFILFFVAPRLLMIYARWKIRRSAQRMQDRMADAFRQRASRNQKSESHTRQGGWDSPRTKKQYGAREGEYVEFEEITVSETTVETGNTKTKTTEAATNYERIVDAQWEEIQ